MKYKHYSKESLIVQKEVGKGRDSLNFSDGVKNSLREEKAQIEEKNWEILNRTIMQLKIQKGRQ